MEWHRLSVVAEPARSSSGSLGFGTLAFTS